MIKAGATFTAKTHPGKTFVATDDIDRHGFIYATEADGSGEYYINADNVTEHDITLISTREDDGMGALIPGFKCTCGVEEFYATYEDQVINMRLHEWDPEGIKSNAEYEAKIAQL